MTIDNPLKLPSLSTMIFWPSDKPVAQICFSEFLRLDGEWVPTVWAMLPQQELRRFQGVAEEGKGCQSSLIFPEDLLSSSQPTIPWITTLNDLSESREPNPRYLRCLLNWKTPFGQTMGRLLGQRGQYTGFTFCSRKLAGICSYNGGKPFA